MKVCVLYSRPPALSAHSGYHLVAAHLPNVHVITAPRVLPASWIKRRAAQLLRAGATSRWYQASSARVETEAARYLHSVQPDILHFLWADQDMGYLAAWVKRLSPRTQLCGTVHAPPKVLRSLLRFPRALHHFDAVITMSNHQAEFLQSYGLPDSRIHFIPHGVDATFFQPGSQTIAKSFRIISVGGYLRNFQLLRSVCIAAQTNPRLQFDIIGPPALAALFANLPNVSFRSGISDAELAIAYQAASCFLLTFTDATANNALLEAMACGLPVVTENHGGIGDYVDREFADACPRGDAQALLSALNRLAEYPALAHQRGALARQRATALDWSVIGQRTAALYREIVA